MVVASNSGNAALCLVVLSTTKDFFSHGSLLTDRNFLRKEASLGIGGDKDNPSDNLVVQMSLSVSATSLCLGLDGWHESVQG